MITVVRIGYHEQTKVYKLYDDNRVGEIRLHPVATLRRDLTIEQLADALRGYELLLIDSAEPKVADELERFGHRVIRGRL